MRTRQQSRRSVLTELPLDLMLCIMRHMRSTPRRNLAKCSATLSSAYASFFRNSLLQMKKSKGSREDAYILCPNCRTFTKCWTAPYRTLGTKQICQICVYDYVVLAG